MYCYGFSRAALEEEILLVLKPELEFVNNKLNTSS
jgi:hypothetical protein